MHSATDVADGGSSARWKPATHREWTSIAMASHGRWISCRVMLSTAITSTNVWSIWISASGHGAVSEPVAGAKRSRAALRPARFARTSPDAR